MWSSSIDLHATLLLVGPRQRWMRKPKATASESLWSIARTAGSQIGRERGQGWSNCLPGSSAESKQWSTRFLPSLERGDCNAFQGTGGTQRIIRWGIVVGTRSLECVCGMWFFLVLVMSGKHFKNNQNFNDFVLLLFLAFILTFYFLHVLVLGLVWGVLIYSDFSILMSSEMPSYISLTAWYSVRPMRRLLEMS